VVGHDSPAWMGNASRPTTVSTWLPATPVVTPDALKVDQDTVDAQYYSLSEATGELLISHSMPSYHPAIAPATLVYSSLAADHMPVFITHFTLDPNQTVAPSWVSAQLKLNGTWAGQTHYYDTSKLNPGDIMEIPAQAPGPITFSAGRYSYEIDLTANYA